VTFQDLRSVYIKAKS